MLRVAILIDGGHLRVLARKSGLQYNPDFIERFALNCSVEGEDIFRILYYDCALFTGTVKLPVSGTNKGYSQQSPWLDELSRKNLFAVRRGVLKFRGFKPKKIPISTQALDDDDFEPVFEQKGVDMRIGLDIALFSDVRSVERILLVSGDTDCIPAMKHGRKAGLQIVMIEVPGFKLAPELLTHCDYKRTVQWPE